MKFRKYIKEKESWDMFGDPIKNKPDRPKDNDTESVVERLRKNCSQILNIYKKSAPLWRGVKREMGNLLELHKGRVSTGRHPRDTPFFVHEYLNAGMKKKVGWPVRNGVPVTTVHMQAKKYGDKFIFFPFNGFKWAYTIGVRDLYIELDDVVVDHLYHGLKLMTKKLADENPWFTEKLDDLIDKTVNRPWKEHAGEVFFNVNKYYLYNPKVESIDGNDYIFKELGLKSFGFHISAAMNS